MVASTNDRYLELDRADELAHAWGAALHVIENAGHINVESGHGPWSYGETLLASLLRTPAFPAIEAVA